TEPFPPATYIRVNPPAIHPPANDARSSFRAAFSAFLICVQLVPLLAERQPPPFVLPGIGLFWGDGPAQSVRGEVGSNAGWWTRRRERRLGWTIPAWPASVGFRQTSW